MKTRRACLPAARLHGFTLVELMVTITVLAVMLTMAVPSFVSFQRNLDLTSVTNTLVGSINAARGEAMKTGRNAYVIPKDGSNWSSGWLVYVDMNADNTYTEGTDALVQTQGPVASYQSITGNNNAAGAKPYISFDSAGYARSIGGTGLTNLTMTIKRTDVDTASASEQTRYVIVARTGRVRACKPSEGATCQSSSAS